MGPLLSFFFFFFSPQKRGKKKGDGPFSNVHVIVRAGFLIRWGNDGSRVRRDRFQWRILYITDCKGRDFLCSSKRTIKTSMGGGNKKKINKLSKKQKKARMGMWVHFSCPSFPAKKTDKEKPRGD